MRTPRKVWDTRQVDFRGHGFGSAWAGAPGSGSGLGSCSYPSSHGCTFPPGPFPALSGSFLPLSLVLSPAAPVSCNLLDSPSSSPTQWCQWALLPSPRPGPARPVPPGLPWAPAHARALGLVASWLLGEAGPPGGRAPGARRAAAPRALRAHVATSGLKVGLTAEPRVPAGPTEVQVALRPRHVRAQGRGQRMSAFLLVTAGGWLRMRVP